jgi:transcriptional regulator with XRE-family HTH domain
VRISIRLAGIVRDGRLANGWTKTALGERTRISRQMIGAVEAARANPSLDVIVGLLEGLGIDVDLAVKGPVIVGSERQRDAAHARCSAYVQRRLEIAGWQVAREVRIESGRYVGWIDLLAFHEDTATLLIIEIKTRLDDVGAIERSMDWHMREAIGAARRLGWRPRRSAGWLLALATDEVDDQVRRNRAIWDSAFPARARMMSEVLRDPGGASSRGFALVDPRSRRRDWLIHTRIDGRRSVAPYRGYADFIARDRRR